MLCMPSTILVTSCTTFGTSTQMLFQGGTWEDLIEDSCFCFYFIDFTASKLFYYLLVHDFWNIISWFFGGPGRSHDPGHYLAEFWGSVSDQDPRNQDCLLHWLTDWQIDRLADWFIDWLIDWLTTTWGSNSCSRHCSPGMTLPMSMTCGAEQCPWWSMGMGCLLVGKV